MSSFWSGWIIALTLICLALVIGVLFFVWKSQRKGPTEETTGHSFDGIEELDNPMPKWWLILFVATIVFSAVYLLLYPGLGSWKGFYGWTSVGELEQAQLKHDRRFALEFARYGATPIDELIDNPKAVRMGQRIFINNCALCHASDAKGNFGFPNLTDNSWLYGGSSDAIKTSIMHGRKGQMPAWGAVIGNEGVTNVTHYVRAMAGLETGVDEQTLAAGKTIFDTTCVVCHAKDGTGNHALGAPNLTDNDWLYGSSFAEVAYTVRNGRNGVMPPWKDILGEEKVHLVAAYIYSLSKKDEKSQ
ncbi:cytochrome-c oxidase, cbb3-type subunit III [Candidatus Sororendozoicomonas aggregata]|uniref:cytochrome-c oxidase, cbb3-type subunit III n=1 Tax=Candidatus Sororendozoicomonas aggregata TaxID=3073239 RepID=UPI002ED4A19E